MQAPFGAFRALKSKYRKAVQALEDSFQGTKNLFEKHNVVFTVGGGLLSAGAAWAGYTARQVHQRKLEEKLQKIEEHMTNVHSLEEQQVKAFTAAAAKTGVSYKTFFATSSTALIVGYALGFRGGRRFVIRRIPPDLLLASKKQRAAQQRGLSRLLSGRLSSAKQEQEAVPPPPTLLSDSISEVGPDSGSIDRTRIAANGAASTISNGLRFSDGLNELGGKQPLGGGLRRLEGEGQPDDRSAVSRIGGVLEQAERSEDQSKPPNPFERDGAKASEKVDAALGQTRFERQMERAMEPERQAEVESPEALDRILQASVPNMNGGVEVEGAATVEGTLDRSEAQGSSSDGKLLSSSSRPNQTGEPPESTSGASFDDRGGEGKEGVELCKEEEETGCTVRQKVSSLDQAVDSLEGASVNRSHEGEDGGTKT